MAARTKQNEIPASFRVEERTLQGNDERSGNAIHAILKHSKWEKRTKQDLHNNLEILLKCCQGLCNWTDAYVKTLS